MKKTLIALLALTALGAAQAQSGLKPGLWETRTVKMVVDGKDLAPQMAAAAEQMKKQLASMPPEQRKKMEALLPPQGSDPMTQRMCVSAEMAQRDQPVVPRPPGSECEQPKINRSGNRTTFEMACKQGGGSMTGKGETVLGGDLVTTKLQTNGKDGAGQAHTMVAETQMKFLGSDCGSIKPIDQLVKEMGAQANQGAAPRPPAGKK